MNNSNFAAKDTSIKEILRSEMKLAMKSKSAVRLQTIRSLLSEIQYEEMNKDLSELTDDQVIQLLTRELKKRKESLEFEEKAGRVEQISSLEVEIAVLKEFLPTPLTAEEISAAVRKILVTDVELSSSNGKLGLIMNKLNQDFPGRVDGKTASEVIRREIG
jgi:uncharacterized protein